VLRALTMFPSCFNEPFWRKEAINIVSTYQIIIDGGKSFNYLGGKSFN
jgi:hypothetical protein